MDSLPLSPLYKLQKKIFLMGKNWLRSSRKRGFTLLNANLNSSLSLVQLASLHNRIGQRTQSFSLHTYTHTPLVLFLWKTLTDTDGTTSNIIPTKDGVMPLWEVSRGHTSMKWWTETGPAPLACTSHLQSWHFILSLDQVRMLHLWSHVEWL